MGLVVMAGGEGGCGGKGRWKGKAGKRLPVWAMGGGDGGVGSQGSTVAVES